MAGLLLGVLFYILMRQKKVFSKRNIIVAVVGLLSIILLNTIGYLRINGQVPNVALALKSVITTPTLSDVAYLCNASIDYVSRFSFTNGKILLSNIVSVIPFISTNGDFGSFISSVYSNPGGEPLIGEPLMDFGFIGIPIIAIFDFLILRLAVQFKNNFFRYEYMVLLFTVPRIVWYGRSFVYTSIIFFVPFMYLTTSLLKRVTKKDRSI
ncbi:hypothetical protein [Companilactobacillus jidongensis]|uniref:hypothetical protein n=1 Tax=Companilactobacillus jidongensis TaxID=2486006 RepID=UPI0038505F1E